MIRGDVHILSQPYDASAETGMVRGAPVQGDLIEMLEAWTAESSEDVAESFEEKGEALLEEYVDQNRQMFSDGVLQNLTVLLRQATAFSNMHEEERAQGAAQQLKQVLVGKIVPIIKSAMNAGQRQRQGRGAAQQIPGRATEARDSRAASARQGPPARPTPPAIMTKF